MRVRYHGGKLKSCFDGKEVTKFKQNSIGKTELPSYRFRTS